MKLLAIGIAASVLFPGTAFSEEKEPAPLYVVMGGFNSCRSPKQIGPVPTYKTMSPHEMGMLHDFDCHVRNPSEKALVDAKVETEQPKTIVTCFGPTGNPIIYGVSPQNAKAPLSRVTVGSNGKLADNGLWDLIRTEAGKRPVILIGHSYGGWLATQAALNLDPAVKVKGIVTIDPISRVHCPVSSFAAGVGIRTFNYVRGIAPPPPVAGCVSAPSDVDEDAQKKITARTEFSLNIYQKSQSTLHSDELKLFKKNIVVEDLKLNEERQKKFPVLFTEPHNLIWQDDAVWGHIRAAVQAPDAPKPAACEWNKEGRPHVEGGEAQKEH